MGLDRFRVVEPGSGITYEYPSLAMRVVFLATAADTGGAHSAFESIHQPGSGAPLHIHHQMQETAYVVEGEFLIRRDREPVQRLGPGAYAHFPKGMAHAFKCVGAKEGKLLFWMTPGGYERFFARLAQLVGAGPPDMKAMAAVAKEYDVDIVGPTIDEDR